MIGCKDERFGGQVHSWLDQLARGERNALLRAALPRVLDAESFALVLRVEADGPLPVPVGDPYVMQLPLLARRHPIVVPDGGAAGRYRLNDLHREFLLAEGWDREPELVRSLHCALARHYEDSGEIEEARYHLQEAGERTSLAASALRSAQLLRRQGRWQALRDLVAGLPEEIVALEPGLGLERAAAYGALGRSRRTLADLDRCGGQLATGAAAVRTRALSLRAAALGAQGSHAEALATARQSAEQAQAADDSLALAEAELQLGVALATTARYAEAREVLGRALELAEGDAPQRACCLMTLGTVLKRLGRAGESVAYLQQAQREFRALGSVRGLASACINLGCVYVLLGEFQPAEELLLEARRLAEEADAADVMVQATTDRAELRLEQRDGVAAAELAAEAYGLALGLGSRHRLLQAALAGAAAQHLLGMLDTAEALAREALDLAVESAAPYEEGRAARLLGAVLCDGSRRAEGVELLRRSIELLTRCGAEAEIIRAQLTLAPLLAVGGEHERATALLAAAAASARRLHLERLIECQAGRLPMVLRAASARLLRAPTRRPLLRPLSGDRGDARPEPAGEAASVRRATVLGPTVSLPEVSVHALGRLRMLVDGVELAGRRLRYGKALELLLYLLLQPDGGPAIAIAAVLWPDSDEQAGRASLHTTVRRLRQALYGACIVNEYGIYRLNPAGRFELDVVEFQRLTDPSRSLSAEDRIARWERAVALYSGAFAATNFGEWAEPVREKCEDRCLDTLLKLAAHYQQGCQTGEALAAAGRAAELDPLCERATQLIVESHLRDGSRDAAHRAYRRFCDRARSEGIESSPELRAVYLQTVSRK